MQPRIALLALAAVVLATAHDYGQAATPRKARIVFTRDPSTNPPGCVATTIPHKLIVKPPSIITWTLEPDSANGEPCSVMPTNTNVMLDFMGNTMLITGVGRGSSSNKIIGSTVMNAPNGTAKYRVLLNKSVVEDPEVDVDNGCQNCGPGGRGSSGGTGQAPGH